MGALIEIVLSGEGLTGGGPKVINAENPVMDYGPQKLADIRELGPANVVISTDLGQPQNPLPVEGLRLLIATMLHHGLSQDQVEAVAKRNPASLLNLE